GGGASSGRAAASEPILATVLPSPGDGHLALLPEPVQALVQVRPVVVLSDPTLSLAGAAFLHAVAADPSAAGTCLRDLAPAAQVLTYAWIGGEADGWLLLVDGTLEDRTVRTCLDAAGASPAESEATDVAVGAAVPLGTDGRLLFARTAPDRRLLGTGSVVEAALRLVERPAPAPPAADEQAPVWTLLRQGEVKLYADIDQLAAVGADFLPLADDADQIGMALRLDEWRTRAVALVRARGAARSGAVEGGLRNTLGGLRRAVLADPRMSSAAAHRTFEEASIERDGRIVRLEVPLDRPVLASLARWFADRAMRSGIVAPAGAGDPDLRP
ncbi:MAG: hypothetical protein QME96_14300, partial [Myxococcota bacterium]|nr:hypothetical protein [Myxococcota bacterium]